MTDREALIVTTSLDSTPRGMLVAHGEAVVCSFRAPDKDTDNEDAAVIVSLGDGAAILAVADGVGSTRSAATASALTVRALADIAREDKEESGTRALIINALERVNEAVRDLPSSAATTAAIVEIDGHRVRAIHVGDSAVLVVGQRGRLRMQTVSHSPVGYAVEAGVMDEGEAMHHEDRHLVSNVIGADDMRIEIGISLPLGRRDTVVLATDGVLDNLHLDELLEFVRAGPLLKAAQRVMTAVQQRMASPDNGTPSKPDDTTLILYRRNV